MGCVTPSIGYAPQTYSLSVVACLLRYRQYEHKSSSFPEVLLKIVTSARERALSQHLHLLMVGVPVGCLVGVLWFV